MPAAATHSLKQSRTILAVMKVLLRIVSSNDGWFVEIS